MRCENPITRMNTRDRKPTIYSAKVGYFLKLNSKIATVSLNKHRRERHGISPLKTEKSFVEINKRDFLAASLFHVRGSKDRERESTLENHARKANNGLL